MNEEHKYTLNENEGQSVLHADHPWEVCNVDDAEGVKKVTQAEAVGLLKGHTARACAHCMADSWIANAYR